VRGRIPWDCLTEIEANAGGTVVHTRSEGVACLATFPEEAGGAVAPVAPPAAPPPVAPAAAAAPVVAPAAAAAPEPGPEGEVTAPEVPTTSTVSDAPTPGEARARRARPRREGAEGR